ncbi:unnamed protein product [Lupinus luteus]|uniref:Plastocyanin-like domain-containing protein n=1 Tax=Lupinus luteus TaxID=3873 RepID=A0AAV1XTC0_LUPLU
MNNNMHIHGYHFTMSPMGQWIIEGDRYTYTGTYDLSLHMVCNGTSMMIPHNDAYIDASFTLPPRRPLSPEVGLRYPMIRNDGVGPSHKEEDEVIELIDIESSVEVIDISDHSEGSSIPGIF